MNRQQKENVIDTLKTELSGDTSTFLVRYKGVTVAQMLDLRKKLRSKGGVFKVAKVTLMKRALKDSPVFGDLEPLLKDQLGIVVTRKDATEVAKILCSFSKDNAQLAIVGGCIDASVMTTQAISHLASLPSREVLYAQLYWTLKAPLFKLARVLTLVKEKKEQEVAPQ